MIQTEEQDDISFDPTIPITQQEHVVSSPTIIYTEEIEEEEEPEEVEEEVKPRTISGVQRSDMNVLLVVRQVLRQQKEKNERDRNANDIRQVDKAAYEIKPNTIESYIMQTLSTTEESMHINSIISHIETLGWKSSSLYHKYAQVSKALRVNSYMFARVSKGRFELRDAFKLGKVNESKSKRINRESISTITKLKDVVADTVSRYQGEVGIYPARVHYIMKMSGFPCSYSYVHGVMQSEKFTKSGCLYKLASLSGVGNQDSFEGKVQGVSVSCQKECE